MEHTAQTCVITHVPQLKKWSSIMECKKCRARYILGHSCNFCLLVVASITGKEIVGKPGHMGGKNQKCIWHKWEIRIWYKWEISIWCKWEIIISFEWEIRITFMQYEAILAKRDFWPRSKQSPLSLIIENVSNHY